MLDNKSKRLKQLTEDLVEASKVSSGNVVLDMKPIRFGELIRQTNGEFEEKFAARGLQMVCKMDEEPLVIMADGRRMWRVVENLYNNIAKYAMPYDIEFRDKLPTTLVGKVAYRKLEEEEEQNEAKNAG